MKKLELHSVSKKQLKQIHTWLRAVIQLLYFIFIPSVYTAAFAGVKYIFTQVGAGDRIELTSFVTVLISDLHIHDIIWQIFLWICLCIRDIGRCRTCFVPIHFQENEKESTPDFR